ncbi:MAG TPA: PAS domain-containing sensor histidine kinase [Anditalea sp.]|nr:PAS domain-containing sensor histidine kinase [Anditalea sp.]
MNQFRGAHNYAIKVANHITAMLAYWDKNQVCQFANSAYINWFGKSQEEMINKITIRELLGPGLYEQNLPYINAVLQGKEQTFERDIPLPSGEIKPSLANYYPDIENGEVKGFFVHVADVSYLKNLEEKLIKSNEITTSQNKRLLNFSNIVSHNLKSYALNIAAVLDLYENAESSLEKQKMIDFLKRISGSFSDTIDHLNEIVISQNLADVTPEPINLFKYIEKTQDTLSVQIKLAQATIINLVDREVHILAIPAYMESILLNFLTNALRYSHPDRKPIIKIESFIEKDMTAVIIEDNGIGINLDKHGSELFGMYKTFHGHPDAKGIGLYISRYQIETMGGEVAIESKEGLGTTFTIYLPSK